MSHDKTIEGLRQIAETMRGDKDLRGLVEVLRAAPDRQQTMADVLEMAAQAVANLDLMEMLAPPDGAKLPAIGRNIHGKWQAYVFGSDGLYVYAEGDTFGQMLHRFAARQLADRQRGHASEKARIDDLAKALNATPST